MAYSVEQWERTRAYYEAGTHSLQKIQDIIGISKGKISEKAKKEQWERGSKSDYIEAKVIIAERKGNEKGTTLEVLDGIADDKIRHLKLVHGASEEILKLSSKMAESNNKQVVVKVKEYSKEHGSSESLDKIDVELDAGDLKNLAEAIDKSSITLGVNARHAPKQDINLTNAIQNNVDTPRKGLGDFYKEVDNV